MKKAKRLIGMFLCLSVFITAVSFSAATVNAAEAEQKVYPVSDTVISNYYTEQDASANAKRDTIDTLKVQSNFDVVDDTGVQIKGHLIRYVFMRYDLSCINKPILSAKFFYTYRNYSSGFVKADLKEIDGEWDENTVIWSNRPALGETFAATGDLAGTGPDYVRVTDGIDVTDKVRSVISGDGIFDFAMVSENGGTGIKVRSNEFADQELRPCLVLTFPDDSYFEKTKITSIESTYTSTNPEELSRERDFLRIGSQGPADWADGFYIDDYFFRNGFLKFDLSNIEGEIVSAALHYTYTFKGNTTAANLLFYEMDNDDWDNEVQWNDMPSFVVEKPNGQYEADNNYFASKYLSGEGKVDLTDTEGIDVTKLLKKEYEGDKILSIGIKNTYGGDHLWLYNDTAAGKAPYLEVTFAKFDIQTPGISNQTLEPSTDYDIYVTASNTWMSDKEIEIIALLFNENNTLVGMKTKKEIVLASQLDKLCTMTFTAPPNVTNGYKLKVYVADDLFSMKPLSNWCQIQK